MILTVQKVRERLGNLVQPVFSTDEFKRKCALLSHCSNTEKADICARHFPLAISYIQSLAQRLDDDAFVLQTTKESAPEVILTVYAIYWQSTRVLRLQDSKRRLFVPDSDAEFLRYMFEQFLGTYDAETDRSL